MALDSCSNGEDGKKASKVASCPKGYPGQKKKMRLKNPFTFKKSKSKPSGPPPPPMKKSAPHQNVRGLAGGYDPSGPADPSAPSQGGMPGRANVRKRRSIFKKKGAY